MKIKQITKFQVPDIYKELYEKKKNIKWIKLFENTIKKLLLRD